MRRLSPLLILASLLVSPQAYAQSEALPPAAEAVVLNPSLFWRSTRWPGEGWTRSAAVDFHSGVPRFTVSEPETRHVWKYAFAAPLDVNAYPIVALTYRAYPNVARRDDFLLWLDDGSGPAYSDWIPLRASELTVDGQAHTLRRDLRSRQGGGDTITAIAIAVYSGDETPASFELVDVRFEADAPSTTPPVPGESITLRVEDADGEPLSGVTVTVDAERHNWAQSQLTGADGVAVLTPLANASGMHMLRLTHSGMVPVEVPGFAQGAAPTRVVLEPGSMYGGLVVMADGVPLPGVAVDVRVTRTRTPAANSRAGVVARPKTVVFTDSRGRWRTPLLPAQSTQLSLRLAHADVGAPMFVSDIASADLRDGSARIVFAGTELTVHRAAQLGMTDWLDEALSADPLLLLQREERSSLVHTAARYNRAQVIELLVQHGATITDSGPGSTPLHVAVESGALEAADILLSLGADPDVRNVADSAPLHHAIWAQSDSRCTTDDLRRAIELLVSRGADINAVHRGVGTPLDYALSVAPVEICDLLRRHGAVTRN